EAAGTIPGDPTGKADEYSAHFGMNQVPDNGPVSFRCAGTDVSDPPISASATLDTFADHWPTITPRAPKDMPAHRLLARVAFSYKAEPSPLTTRGDKGAALDKVVLTVNTTEIPSEMLHEENGEYTAEIDLNDGNLFNTTLSGNVPYVIEATNRRS